MPALFMAAKACRPVPSQPPPGLAGSMTLTWALAAAAKSEVAAMQDRKMPDSFMSAPKGFVVIGNNSEKNRLDQDGLSIRERERTGYGRSEVNSGVGLLRITLGARGKARRSRQTGRSVRITPRFWREMPWRSSLPEPPYAPVRHRSTWCECSCRAHSAWQPRFC